MKSKIFVVLMFLTNWGLVNAAEFTLATNQEVAQTWNRSTASQTGPTLAELEGGQFVLSKRTDLSLESYSREVTAAAGPTTTSNGTGSFYRLGAQTDIRKTNEKDESDYFLASLTHSKDSAVLSQTQNQINNLQFGRARESYILSAGDVAPSFSTLSTSLGARGVLGQRAFGHFLGTAYLGVVADSWEAIANSVPRSNFLKEVYGIKLEKDIFVGMNVYLTTQNSQDQRDSLTEPTVVGTLNASSVSVSTLGFDYKPSGNFQLSAELAQSQKRIDTQNDEPGKSGIVDISYRIGEITLQTGYHDIDGTFNSLSSRVSAGIRETFLAAAWKATTWLKFDTSKREARNFLPAVGFGLETNYFTKSDSFTIGLNPVKDLTINLQKSQSDSEDFITPAIAKNEQSGIGVKYIFSKWVCSAQVTSEQVRNEAAITLNSDTEKNRFSISRFFTADSFGVGEPDWQVDSKLDMSSQSQKLVYSGETTSQQATTLGLNVRLKGRISVDTSVTESKTTRLSGLADLKSHGKELALAKEFSAAAKGRLYYRNFINNEGDDFLKVEESLVGAQFNYGF